MSIVTGAWTTAGPVRMSASTLQERRSPPLPSLRHTSLSVQPGSPLSPNVTMSQSVKVVRRPSGVGGVNDSAFGVCSLGEGASDDGAASLLEQGDVAEVDKTNPRGKNMRRRSTLRPCLHPPEYQVKDLDATPNDNGPRNLPRDSAIRIYTSPNISHSATSISLSSQGIPSSLPSSPHSRYSSSLRPSDEELQDGNSSQAVASSDEDVPHGRPSMDDSVPQLIMPSIKMPSRRPFTEKGQSMGRLKILIAGRRGLGKTSLIKSMVQLTEDIVHVDNFPVTMLSDQSSSPRPRYDLKRRSSTSLSPREPTLTEHPHISEISASTKPYPTWWSEFDEGKLVPRRKILGDTVLERNVCFVDVSGETDSIVGLDHLSQYISSQLSRILSFDAVSDHDLMNLLGGSGGSQVDLILWLLDADPKAEELSAIGSLSQMTNVIPLLAKSDLYPPSDLDKVKEDLQSHLVAKSIESFKFSSEPQPECQSPTLPYAVCSAISPDTENMDASLLMSPEYVQPIQSSDLSYLLSSIFEPINMGKLRYTAARKLVRSHNHDIHSSSAPPMLRNALLEEHTNAPRYGTYLQARILAHTTREEMFAQARLAKWATDLQRGLTRERARYEALADQARAKWLEEQISAIESAPPSTPSSPAMRFHRQGYRKEKRLPAWSRTAQRERINVDDPLGLTALKAQVREHSWTVLKWLGVGAFAGVIFWGYRVSHSEWECQAWDCFGLSRIGSYGA